ncbi:MAG: alpha/beta fold hydrolase [Geodermatophilaceae bacterium]
MSSPRSADPSLRLLLYDQRGHGASGWGDPERATIDQIADDLARVIDERVPTGRIALVGHSMGGMAIMGLAERRPELFGPRVVGVALLSTSTGNLASVGFGMPQAITGLSTAVLPVLAKLARRRPAGCRAHPAARQGRRVRGHEADDASPDATSLPAWHRSWTG